MASSNKAKLKAAVKTSKAKASAKNDPTANWAAYNPQRWNTDRLVPSARNAKMHTDAQVALLAGLIEEYGWTMPVLVDERGGIIAGHGRILAAKSLGIEEVPVIVAKGWSERQKRAYMLADNRSAEVGASWNTQILMQELTELGADGFELPTIGFDADFMQSMTAGPEIAAKPLGPTVVSQSTSFEGPDDDDQDDGYAPNLEPSADKGEVTSRDVEKAAAGLAGNPGDQAKQNLVELICPHCGESYEVDRASIA